MAVSATEDRSTDIDADDQEIKGLKHLKEALAHAEQEEELFPDDSKGESVAYNVRRWAEKSVELAERDISAEKYAKSGEDSNKE